MPTWKNVLPESDLWALAYYVRSLAALRATAAADQLRQRLRDQPVWTPPSLDGGDDGGAGDDGGGAAGDATTTSRAPP